MTIYQIITLKDEEQKMEELRKFNNYNNLSYLQKINLISSIGKTSNKIELLCNPKLFDVQLCIHALDVSFTKSEKKEIATLSNYEYFRNLIRNSSLSADNIRRIISVYGGEPIAFNFLDSSKEYYRKHENIILRGTTKKYDEAAIDRILNMEGVSRIHQPYIKKNIKDLLDINEDVLETVNFEILKKKYERIQKKLGIFTLYPQLQEKIVGLSDKEFNFLCGCIDYCKALHIDWIPIVDSLTENINDYSSIINRDAAFSRFIRNMNAENGYDKDFMRVLTIMTEPNKFKYESFHEMMNSNRADRINYATDKEFFKLTEVQQHKSLLSLKLLGIDYNQVNRLYEYYCHDFEKTIKETEKSEAEVSKYVEKIKGLKPGTKEHKAECDKILKDNKTVKNVLISIKKIMDCDDIEKLDEMYRNAGEAYNIPLVAIDSVIRQFFARLKLDVLYMPEDKDKIIVDGEEVFLIPPGKYWQITSLEAYSDYSGKEVPDWNMKKIKNHLVSTVFGSSKNMSLPPVNGVCYAFCGYDERTLLKSGPWDLGGWAFCESFDIYKRDSTYPAQFYTPETQLKWTLRRHGEDSLDRNSYSYEDDKIFKIQPAYTVSFVEPALEKYFTRDVKESEVLTAELLKSVIDYSKMNDMSYRRKLIESELVGDPKWEKTKIDTKKNGLKKTVVDRTHDLIVERLELDKMEEEILKYNAADLEDPNKMKEFFSLVQDMIEGFDAARAGNIQTEFLGEWNPDTSSKQGDLLHKEMHDKLFSRKVMDDKLQKIEKIFKSVSPDKYKMCMQEMQKICKLQIDKLEKQYWWYELDTSHDWYRYFNKTAREITGMTYSDEHNVIQGLLDRPVNGMSITGGQAVKKTIEEKKYIKEYDIPAKDPDWHGRRHINNVVLFSYLIAAHEGKLTSDMDILLQAAKYHDVGRDGVWNGLGEGKRHDLDLVPHAYPSALAAEFYMKKELNPDGSRKYTDAQIAIVKVAIAYHEVNEKNKNEFDENTFTRLCEKEHVRPEDMQNAKLICIYLKDADALDRTRFVYNNNEYYTHCYDNLDFRYLRTNAAIALRDYSRSINDIHYRNGRGSKYIPKELDKYSIPSVPNLGDWDTTRKEIRSFLSNKDISGDTQKLTISDVEKIVKNTSNKGVLFRLRQKIKELFKSFTQNRTKKKSKDEENYIEM